MEMREQHPLLGHTRRSPGWSNPAGWRMQAKNIPVFTHASVLGLMRKHLHLNCWSYCFSSVRTYAWQAIYSRLQLDLVASLVKILVMLLALRHKDLAPSFIVNNFRGLPRQREGVGVLILPFSAHRRRILGDHL